MLISTAEELRQYMPTHSLERIDSMSGYLDNSEHDFLVPRIGTALHRHLTEAYREMMNGDPSVSLVAHAGNDLPPTPLLISLCQRCITFDAFARSADIRAVSINGGGFNDAATDGYDTSSQDSIKAFKLQCVKEAHAATNRLLLQLEEWAKEVSAEEVVEDGSSPNEGPRAEKASLFPTEASSFSEEKKRLVDLWKSSPYYYRIEGLLLPTASALSEYLDIYESRERFVQLIPDMRYLQENTLSEEIGDDLLEDLTQKNALGKGNSVEKKAIAFLQRALALLLEDRNKMFKRDMAHSEAIQAVQKARKYIIQHLNNFDADKVKTSPFAPKVDDRPKHEWENNRKGNVLFAAKPIF